MPISEYEVQGPLLVPVTKNPGGRVPDMESILDLWQNDSAWRAIAKKKGCYVFALKAAKGYKPIYVGKATRSFKQECFAPHKQVKLLNALSLQQRGHLYLFLLCGSRNKAVVDNLETFLIQVGTERNEHLQNDRKRPVVIWSVTGVFNSKRGQPSSAAQKLRRVFGR